MLKALKSLFKDGRDESEIYRSRPGPSHWGPTGDDMPEAISVSKRVNATNDAIEEAMDRVLREQEQIKPEPIVEELALPFEDTVSGALVGFDRMHEAIDRIQQTFEGLPRYKQEVDSVEPTDLLDFSHDDSIGVGMSMTSEHMAGIKAAQIDREARDLEKMAAEVAGLIVTTVRAFSKRQPVEQPNRDYSDLDSGKPINHYRYIDPRELFYVIYPGGAGGSGGGGGGSSFGGIAVLAVGDPEPKVAGHTDIHVRSGKVHDVQQNDSTSVELRRDDGRLPDAPVGDPGPAEVQAGESGDGDGLGTGGRGGVHDEGAHGGARVLHSPIGHR